MRRELGELRSALRDEAYHLRVITRELRNRADTLQRAIGDSLERIDRMIDELEHTTDDPQPTEAHGHESERNARAEALTAARHR